jgi:starch synthase
MGVPVNSEKPLLGFIGRLVEQKGVDLLLTTLPALLSEDRCQVVILGAGMQHYEEALSAMARQHPRQLSLTLGYSESMAHRIEAGADIFLMPSLFEPCGLNQMYSLRYGTPPVAHAVGGLRDTIRDNPEQPDEADGFLFHQPTPAAFAEAIERALAAYHDPAYWKKLQRNGMGQDFSWDASAQAYLELYNQLSS